MSQPASLSNIDAMERTLRMLFAPKPGSSRMRRHQIFFAAHYFAHSYGTEWTFKSSSAVDTLEIEALRGTVEKLVKRVVGSWHPDADRVWRAFRNYALSVAAREYSRSYLKDIMKQPRA